MSLPESFDNPEEYFEESLKFFHEYQYLFNYPNTDILVHNILDKITIQDVDTDVFSENFDLSASDDEFLKTFLARLEKMQVSYKDIDENLDSNINVPVSAKKKHEIIYLAREIKEMCDHVGCDVVVDFGSGLGYLDQRLFETTNYKILGLECNESHYVGAKIRQRKYHSNSIDNVKYIKHTVTESSHKNIEEFLQDKFGDHRGFCITGLHACADLTIDALNLFLNMADAKAMVLMPCCYHKMVENGGFFKNVPLSDCLKNIFRRFKGEEFMKVPFLRLATQPPSVDSRLEELVFNLLSRAVLQLFAVRHNCKLRRNKRKAVKTKTMDRNFETYIQDATTNGFTLLKNDSMLDSNMVENPQFCLSELTTFWNEIPEMTFKKAGVFILLQNYMQPVLENFVLYDRIVYLKENGVSNCEFKKILNVKTSPRCLALLAYK